MKKYLYYAYGSNLNLGQMEYRCPDAEVMGTAQLEEHELFFHKVASVRPESNSIVMGGLFNVSKDDLASLDRYEGYPHLYRREVLPVRCEGRVYQAIVYIMNGDLEEVPPSDSYYDCIEEGYGDFSIPLEGLQEARRRSQEVFIDLDPATAFKGSKGYVAFNPETVWMDETVHYDPGCEHLPGERIAEVDSFAIDYFHLDRVCRECFPKGGAKPRGRNKDRRRHQMYA